MAKNQPGKEKIHKKSIIHDFPNLTGKKKLPISVLNALDQYEDLN